MEPLEKIVSVYSYTVGRRSSRLVGRLGELELHIIKDMIKHPEHVQLSGSHFKGVPIHLKSLEWPGGVLSFADWVTRPLLVCNVLKRVPLAHVLLLGRP